MTLITRAVNGYIEGRLGLPQIVNDMFIDDTSEGIVSRHDPSTARETDYIDGSAEGVLNIAYWARYKDAAACRRTLDMLIDCVDGVELEDGGGSTMRVTAVTLPQYVETDDKNMTTYTASIRVEYERNNEV
ncbi:MAG: hypothetical protein J6N15_00200 [Ruminiclostridium sp.]|nr:hypothetical protein [Ruminiclostridium sp.]